mgnify:CR=1 FL=1
MYVTYSNLFKLLIDKGLNKTEFAREVGISSNTLAKLSKNELVSLEVLVRICQRLDCHSAISCRSSRTSRRQGTVSSVR